VSDEKKTKNRQGQRTEKTNAPQMGEKVGKESEGLELGIEKKLTVVKTKGGETGLGGERMRKKKQVLGIARVPLAGQQEQ